MKISVKNTKLTDSEYAEGRIVPQKYENLLPATVAFKFGTIFKDLCSPYEENEKLKYKERCIYYV